MTLKNRNRVYFAAALLTLALLAAYDLLFIYAALRGQIIPPENPVRIIPSFSTHFLFEYNFYASLAAIFVFILYVPIVAFVMSSGFGNTQALELIYFGGFLIACTAETVRILVPLFGLWKSYSLLLVLTGRIIITGRLLSFISLLFTTIFNEISQRQNAERNFAVMFIIAVFIGVIMPLETTQTSSACTVLWGFGSVFLAVRICIFILTELTLILNAITKSNRELIKTAVAYPMLILGYSILGITDNYIMLITGSALLAVGTATYLKSIHSVYMWQ